MPLRVTQQRFQKTVFGTYVNCWNVFTFEQSYFRDIIGNRICSGYEVIKELKKHPEAFSIDYSPFFDMIMNSF